MPDAIGFALATAFLATAFTVFGIIGRIVDGVISEIRLTVAPTMVAGVRAWGDELPSARRRRAVVDESSDDGAGHEDTTERDGGRRDDGILVPVQRVRRGGWPLFARLVARRSA